MKQLTLGLTAARLDKIAAYYKKQADLIIVMESAAVADAATDQSQMNIGDRVKLRTSGETGTVVGFGDRNENGCDIDIVVEWDSPVLGEFTTSEAHPTELEYDKTTKYGSLDKDAYAPDHPEKIKIKSEYYPKGISEQEIYDYWKSVESKLLPALKDYYVMTYIQADGNIIRKRNDENGNPIKVITPEDYEKYIATGGTVEVHTVLPEDRTKVAWVDIDPKGQVPFEKTKDITQEVSEMVGDMDQVSDTQIRFSGGRGFHIIMTLHSPVEINQIKASLKETLLGYIEVKRDAKITTGVTKDPEGIRLDISTLNKLGSIRAPYSLNATTGLADVPLKIEDLATFQKDNARINHPFEKDAELETLPKGYIGSFVIQEHKAEKAGLHWDLRLEWPI
jgi:hypothetical protein